MVAEGVGPRPVPDQLCLQGILFVLHAGIGWEDLPQELGFGSRDDLLTQVATLERGGVFDQAHRILLAKLNAVNRIRLVTSGDGRQ